MFQRLHRERRSLELRLPVPRLGNKNHCRPLVSSLQLLHSWRRTDIDVARLERENTDRYFRWGHSVYTMLTSIYVRIINQINYRGHTDPLFKSERMLNTTDLYKLHVSLFMFDLQSG